jgi:hypothetical protein
VFTSPAKIYDIYWVPSGYSVASGYQATVDGFVGNLAAAGGPTTNVFYTGTQYTDGSGAHIAGGASFGGSATVSDPLPASGCADSSFAKAPCMSDIQVSNEIHAAAQANGWSVTYPNVFVMLMPKGVGNCATTSTGAAEGYCSVADACAWHHQWGGLYFIVQPYVGNQTGCQSGQAPAGNYDGNQAVNTMSHELNETLTDPAGNAWYDSSGYEDGDKCSWNFGAALGGASGALYNQVINGSHYYLQQEWSNASSACVQQGT